jgi:hypothetical protein
LERAMRLPKQHQPGVLPKDLPVGTVYVVEGRGGEAGCLRVSSRYLIIPGGGRIDLLSRPDPARSDRAPGRSAVRGSAGKQRPAGTGTKESAAGRKKFVVVAGTAA